jgi:hypothetical protein
MSRTKIILTLLAVTFAPPLGLADKASAAKKKVTYEQAWKICLDELNKENVYGVGLGERSLCAHRGLYDEVRISGLTGFRSSTEYAV